MGHARISGDVTAEFIDEVHRTEEEIDLFLRGRSEKAREILSAAEKESGDILKAAEKGIADRSSELHKQLLEEAQEQARIIREAGRLKAEQELRRLQSLRQSMLDKILALLTETAS